MTVLTPEPLDQVRGRRRSGWELLARPLAQGTRERIDLPHGWFSLAHVPIEAAEPSRDCATIGANALSGKISL